MTISGLGAKLLLRDWRAGELRALFAAILIATLCITSISLFTDRVERAMTNQASALLGGDSVLTSTKKIKVLLVGIRIPPNYGEKYTKQFQQVFLEVANENNIALVPKLLDEIGGKSKLMQTDGVHPTEAAQKIMLENIWKELEKLLPKNAEK